MAALFLLSHPYRRYARRKRLFRDSAVSARRRFRRVPQVLRQFRSEGIQGTVGMAGRTFYDSRIEIVRGCLSPQKQKEFDELSYERKVIFIGRALERGLLI